MVTMEFQLAQEGLITRVDSEKVWPLFIKWTELTSVQSSGMSSIIPSQRNQLPVKKRESKLQNLLIRVNIN
jgi:hypothetical protein